MKSSIFIAVLLLTIGSGIYLTCRQNVIFLAPLQGTKFLEFLKVDIQYEKVNVFIYFLLFCLPDSLWYAALLLLQRQFYNRNVAISEVLCYLAISLPFILEFLQYFKVITGTFDILDVSFYLLTFLIFIVLWNKKKVVLSYNFF